MMVEPTSSTLTLKSFFFIVQFFAIFKLYLTGDVTDGLLFFSHHCVVRLLGAQPAKQWLYQ